MADELPILKGILNGVVDYHNAPVRFGRVPKREKARILAAMQQSSISRSVEKVLAAELEDECALYHNVVRAHLDTCDFTREKVQPMLDRAREQPSYTACPATLACPLNPNPVPLTGQQELLQDFSKRFSPAIRGVVEFAKRIPGFILLGQDDQVTLLKAGVFEVLLVRLACLFDGQTNSMVCLNGQVLKRESIHNSSNARFLMDSMFDFAERLNSLRLSDAEVGLFCSIVVISSDRPGLRNTELVERMQTKLRNALQIVINQNHPGQTNIMADLIKKIPDLRTLNTLHSEKLLAFKMTEHQQFHHQQHIPFLHQPPQQPQQQLPQQQLPQQPQPQQQLTEQQRQDQQRQQHLWNAMMMCAPDVDDSSKSPAGSSSWSSASDVTMDEVVKSPLGSVSSSESVCSGEVASLTDYPSAAAHNSHASSAPLLAATLAGAALCPHRHRANSGSTSGEDDMAAHNSMSGAGSSSRASTSHARFHRKLDSPSDSGIESGTEKLDKAGHNSAPTSVCSSPRSSLEDKDEHSHQSSHVEDMPVLKRVLQAPPLYDTNSLMDEAYKPHKKFRALRHKDSAEAEAMVVSPAPGPAPCAAPTSTPMNVSPLTSSLSSTHSTLARSLMEGPRMTAEQLKRTDIIHNYIMAGPVDLASSTQQHVMVTTSPTYHYIPQPSTATSQPQLQPQQRWSVASTATATVTSLSPAPAMATTSAQQSQPLSGVITSAPAAPGCPYSAAAAGSPSPPQEFSRIYLSPVTAASPSSTSPSPLHRKSPACSPESSTPPAPKLVELQVGIAANSQPLNLSKKSPSPSPRPLSAPAPHKVLSLEA